MSAVPHMRAVRLEDEAGVASPPPKEHADCLAFVSDDQTREVIRAVASPRFPGLRMAWDALRAPFGSCAVMNAANEVAVQAFLDERICFTDIHRVNSATLNAMDFAAPHNLDDLLALDQEARSLAEQQVEYCRAAA